MNINAQNEQDTEKAACDIAKTLKNGDILALYGDLGLGKTVFARAMIRALAKDEALEVPSPTFTLLQTYDGTDFPIWHFDLYRLKETDEIYELGWEDALSEGVVIIEWPEKLGNHLPKERVDIRLRAVENKPKHRTIQVTRNERASS